MINPSNPIRRIRGISALIRHYLLLSLLLLSLAFRADAQGKGGAEHMATPAVAGSQVASRSIDDEPVDPRTWRMLHMTMTAQGDLKVDITLLRPQWWIEEAGAEEGESFHLNLDEMDLRGPARVDSIGPLPFTDIRHEGTVTGTYSHFGLKVLDLKIEGESKPIRVTAAHPFRSAETNQWVIAGNLKPGDLVVTRGGTAQVLWSKKVTESIVVHNLEIHGTHTYYVGDLDEWVHNACSTKLGRALEKALGALREANMQAQHLIPGEFEGRPLLERAKRAGWNIDGANNGMWLPDNARLGLAKRLPYHYGSHPRYSVIVGKKLDRLEKIADRLTDAELVAELESISASMKQFLIEMGQTTPGGKVP